MSHVLALLAPHTGRIALSLLWLSVVLAGLDSNGAVPERAPAQPLRRVLERVEAGSAVALAAAPDGDVWWVTREQAVRFRSGDPTRREVAFASQGELRDAISTAHVDARGGLWLGSRRGAVLHHRNGVWRELPRRAGEATHAVNAIATRADEVYVAGFGLWRGSIDGGPLEEFGPFTGVPVDRVAADANHGVSVAARGTVWRSDGGGWRDVWRARERDGAVSALAIAPDGELWIGTADGLVRVDRAGRARRELIGARVAALSPGDGGAALAGTRGSGLFARYAAGWRRVGAAGDLDVSSVSELAPARFGVLWLAMGERGLYRAGS